MKPRKDKQIYLYITSVLASFAVVNAVASDAADKGTSRTSDDCSSYIAADQNKVEFQNCDDINLDLVTENGSEIKIDAKGAGNTVIVESNGENSASVSQKGSGNSVVINQSSSSHSSADYEFRKKMMKLRREHEKRIQQRRIERYKRSKQ